MNKKLLIIAAVLVAVGAVVGGLFGRMPAKASAESGVSKDTVLADYTEAMKAIDENYAGTVDHEKVSDSSMQSMLWTLDPHSTFFTQAEFRKLDEVYNQLYLNHHSKQQ